MNGRSKLRRWHIWLAWVAAVPVLLWILSGLAMVARPIEEVRGEGLLKPPGAIRIVGTPIPPLLDGIPLASLSLEQRAAGPRWVVKLPDGTKRLANPQTGLLLPALSAADALREVQARYTGDARARSVQRTSAKGPPLDLRRPIAAWRVTMSDGTRFYVDSTSGEIVATRTRWWRFYDLMWGFHIMDLKSREDTHNPLVIAFGLTALAMTVAGIVLLLKTVRQRPTLDS
jgi:uncharacterized iron-regulated membrane protein